MTTTGGRPNALALCVGFPLLEKSATKIIYGYEGVKGDITYSSLEDAKVIPLERKTLTAPLPRNGGAVAAIIRSARGQTKVQTRRPASTSSSRDSLSPPHGADQLPLRPKGKPPKYRKKRRLDLEIERLTKYGPIKVLRDKAASSAFEMQRERGARTFHQGTRWVGCRTKMRGAAHGGSPGLPRGVRCTRP